MISYLIRQMKGVNRDQEGQSIVFVTLILMTLASFVAVTINIGNFVATKIRMQNVVDAAALNGAIWEARGFNLVQALNAAVFSGDWVFATELAENVVYFAEAASCGFIPPPCWPAVATWLIDLALLFEDLFNIEHMIENINDLQETISSTITPLNITIAYASELFLNPYNESSFYYILPGTYFFSGSVLFEDTPWGGSWYDLFLGKLACRPSGGGLFFDYYFATSRDYPQHQWLFSFAYREQDEEPMFKRQFDAGGIGYFVMAQARPYSKANSNWLSYTHIYDGNTWDVKLMPVNFDDMLWGTLFGWFPPLQWLFAAISNTLLLH
ncbi:Tad domain-containing protein [bacterium]|nr:Tad domain-containing protein [candidate division CSSED10-310 bacterium]